MGKPVRRSDLQRALVVNAATKPVNVAVPAAVLVAGLLLGTLWLLPVAVLVYVVLAVMTFFDEDEAQAVGERAYATDRTPRPLEEKTLAPKIREFLEAARRERAAIDKTIRESDLGFDTVAEEVDALLAAVEATARRAQRVHDHLMQRPSGTAQSLRHRLRSYHDEMAAVVGALRDIHDRLVEASVANEEERDAQLAGDVRDLRARVDAVTTGLGEAYGTSEPAPPGSPPRP